jgi:hypothetical protein
MKKLAHLWLHWYIRQRHFVSHEISKQGISNSVLNLARWRDPKRNGPHFLFTFFYSNTWAKNWAWFRRVFRLLLYLDWLLANRSGILLLDFLLESTKHFFQSCHLWGYFALRHKAIACYTIQLNFTRLNFKGKIGTNWNTESVAQVLALARWGKLLALRAISFSYKRLPTR